MQNATVKSVPVLASTQKSGPASATAIAVSNSQSSTAQVIDGVTVHAIPTLDGFGLLIVALLLGAAALWIWRRQQ